MSWRVTSVLLVIWQTPMPLHPQTRCLRMPIGRRRHVFPAASGGIQLLVRACDPADYRHSAAGRRTRCANRARLRTTVRTHHKCLCSDEKRKSCPEIIRRAFRVACSGKPGRASADPEDMLLAEVDPARVSLHVETECKHFPAYPMLPAPGKLRTVLDMLTSRSDL